MTQEKTIILESQDIIVALERAQYETEAHKDLLTWMLNNAYNISSKPYQIYHQEYVNIFKEYQKIKHQFEQECVQPKVPTGYQLKSWYLDYQTNRLTIIYSND